MIAVCGELGLHPVFQCCEHLNRALVMEQALLDRLNLTQVNVMPVPKAGGSTGAAAYQRFEHPAVAQFIQADAAIDVGDTLVGMHVRPVAVPGAHGGQRGGPGSCHDGVFAPALYRRQPGAVSQRLMRQRTITKPGADRHRLSRPRFVCGHAPRVPRYSGRLRAAARAFAPPRRWVRIVAAAPIIRKR